MLQQRMLGKTDLSIAPLALGTVKLGRNLGVKYPNFFQIPDEQEAKNLLVLARELNINLLDTAPAYGNSESRLGKLLKGQRLDWVIATKVGEEFNNGVASFNFSKQHITASIYRSLQRLQTDYLDIVLVHSDGNDVNIINNFEVFSVLAELKTKGVIRAYGMSSKTVEGGKLTIEHADLAMVSYNPIAQEMQPVLDLAKQLNKGILIKKALASGHLELLPGKDPVSNCMQFIFSHSAVSSVVVGSITPAHLRQNVLAACMALAT